MKTGFGRFIALVLLAGFGWEGQSAAPPEPLRQDGWIRMELTDGSLLMGKNGLENVALETEYAVLTVPARDIKTLSFDSPAKRATLLMRNNDKISGRLSIQKWPLSTLLGDLSVDVGSIKRMTVFDNPVSPSEGLVLWNGMGSAQEVQNSFVGPGGVLRGNVGFVPGKEGNGAQINGAGGIQFPPESLRGFDQPTTIEWWFRIPEGEGGAQMLLWAHQAAKVAGIAFALTPDRRLCLALTNCSGDSFVENHPVTGPLSAGEWHHVALTWDVVNMIDGKDTVRLYLDGNIAFHTSAKPRCPPYPFRAVDSHLNIILGCQGYDGKIDDSVFGGEMDEFKVWDHVITDFGAAR